MIKENRKIGIPICKLHAFGAFIPIYNGIGIYSCEGLLGISRKNQGAQANAGIIVICILILCIARKVVNSISPAFKFTVIVYRNIAVYL